MTKTLLLKKALVGAAAVIAMVGMSGCAAFDTVKNFAAGGAEKVAEAQCGLSPEARYAERKLYFEANGEKRLLVGFCKGEDGFDNAVAEYVAQPSALLEIANSAVDGDYAPAALELVKTMIQNGKLTADENGCITLPDDAGQWCLPPSD